MRLAAVALLALGCAGTARASVEEAEVSSRLSSQAEDFLNQMLGLGRAKVVVAVHGENSQEETQSEVLTPISKKTNSAQIMPGYVAESETRVPLDYVQKDIEHSVHTSGLTIKNMQVTVVLDKDVSKEEDDAVRRVLPDFLHLSAERKDDLTILRAPLLEFSRKAEEQARKEMWTREGLRKLLWSPDGMRTLAHVGGLGTLAILASLVACALAAFLSLAAYLISMRVVRTFAREVGARREPLGFGAPGSPTAITVPGAGGSFELNLGVLPTMTETGQAPAFGAPRPVQALGHRFDFLASQNPKDTADILVKETPQDLALLFGYLADSNPDLSTKLFAFLPVSAQGPVSEALMQLTMADPERLAMLESRLKSSVEFGVRGADRLGRILSRLPPQEREELLGDLMSKDRGGAEEVEKSLFPFENIAKLAPTELRRLLGAIPHQEWAVALRGAPEEMLDGILPQLPAGVREMVRDAIEIPQPREKILEARSKILSQAFELASKGLLTLGREGASPEVI